MQFTKVAVPSSPNITLNLVVLGDSIVKNRTLFPELKKRPRTFLPEIRDAMSAARFAARG